MKNDTGYIKRIPSLFLPFQVDENAVHSGVNAYIDKIDGETERLERSYNNDNMNEFIGVLQNIQNMLDKISAKRHEAYTVTLIRSSRNGNNKYSTKVLQQAIADFLLLSIEMQKAQSMPSYVAYKSGDVEESEEAARNLSAVVQLIDAQEYDKAKALVNDMSGRGMDLSRLSISLNNGVYDNAKEHAITLQNYYSGLVTKVEATKSTKTVLAVDDRPEILTSVNAALSSHFKTLGAPGGRVAMDIVSKHDIGLFILDIDMPDMNGFELATQIREIAAHTNTPLIFLTGNSSREYISAASNIGCNDFLVKPVSNEHLLTVVGKYLNE
jgi:CheY-like chemotaxis protein